MSTKQLSKTQLTEVYGTLQETGGNLGQRYMQPATSERGEQVIKLIKYNVGSGPVTCTSHDLLVPYANTSTGILDPTVYAADKTNFLRGTGKFCVVSLGTFIATKLYGYGVVKGESYIAATTTNIAWGNPLTVQASGTDKIAEAIKTVVSAPFQTMTTHLINQIAGDVFGVALESVAAAASKQKVYMYGH